MLRLLKARKSQGWPYIPKLREAAALGYRGRPVVTEQLTEGELLLARKVCPTGALGGEGAEIDLGLCTFCGACEEVSGGRIRFTHEVSMAATHRDDLVVRAGQVWTSARVSKELRALFGRSLKLRSVSAGGCNGCELEINAISNVNFDIGRFGIDFVASPRHADALVLSGPVTRNMAEALTLTYEAMPSPKFVIAVGVCAISGGVFRESEALDREFLERFTPSLYVPGCPPHPLTLVNGILDLLGLA